MSRGSYQVNLQEEVQDKKDRNELGHLHCSYKLAFIIINIFNSQKLYHK